MSTTGMLSPASAPRTAEELLQLKRGVRYRLGMQISMFQDDASEQAFLSESDENQAQALAAGLQQYDANNGGAPAQQQQQAPQMGQPTPPPAQMQIPMQQPAPAQQPQMPQQPVMPPPAPQMPQQQPMQQPSMPTQQPVPQGAPQMPPAPSMPTQPQMPAQPSMPMQQPQMPQQAPPQAPAMPSGQPPERQPQTASDPTNAGSSTNMVVPQVLKQVSETLSKNQKWIEEVNEQVVGNTQLITVLLTVLLTLAEQQGLDDDTLIKLIKANGGNPAEQFLMRYSEVAEGKDG